MPNGQTWRAGRKRHSIGRWLAFRLNSIDCKRFTRIPHAAAKSVLVEAQPSFNQSPRVHLSMWTPLLRSPGRGTLSAGGSPPWAVYYRGDKGLGITYLGGASPSILQSRLHRVHDTMRKLFAAGSPSAYVASGSRLAACAALWCGVHCALTPFLMALAPALALSEGIERAAWGATVLLGATMLFLGPARRHAKVIIAFAGGAALWAASLAGWLEPLPEVLTSATGSLTLAGALFQGVRICQSGACAICDEDKFTDRGI